MIEPFSVPIEGTLFVAGTFVNTTKGLYYVCVVNQTAKGIRLKPKTQKGEIVLDGKAGLRGGK